MYFKRLSKMQVKLVFLLSLSILSFNSVQSQDICNFTVSLSQELLWDGFHRNLTYIFDFENHSLHKKNPVYFYDGCIVAVQQLLPQGIYVDPDELENLRRDKQLSAFPHNGINIEVAAPYAHPFNAYIFGLVKFNKLKTFLPVHARYQSPVKGGGMAKNVINAPSIYMRCPDNRLEDCEMPIKNRTYLCDKDPLPEEKCVWKQAIINSSDVMVTWRVPVGNLDHFYVVEFVTMAIVVLGSLSMLKTIHDFKACDSRRSFM